MIKYIATFCFYLLLIVNALAQNTGIGTDNPQATLDVHGTFRLGESATVNGISADSLLLPGSDSLLITQLALRRYIKNGRWAPNEGEVDSLYQVTSQSEAFPYIQKVVEQNGMAYVLTYQGLWIFDVSDPDTIIQRDSTHAFLTPASIGSACDLEVQGEYAYITSYGDGLFGVFDVSNPDSIVFRSRNMDGYGAFRSFVVDSGYAYVLNYNWSTTFVIVYDIQDPDTVIIKSIFSNPIILAAFEIEKTGKWLWLINPTSYYYLSAQYMDWYRVNSTNPESLYLQNWNSMVGYNLALTTRGNQIYFAQTYGDRSFLRMFSTSQTTNQITATDPIVIPTPLDMHASGNELYLSAMGQYYNNASYSTIVNFDISNNQLIPGWVYEGSMNGVHAISHERFLGVSSRLYAFKLFPQQDKRDLIRHTDGTLSYCISPWYTDTLNNLTLNNGYVGIGTDHPGAKLHLHGDQRIDGHHTIEFGADVPGKDTLAGKIGYGLLTNDALDIVGAGPTDQRRFDLYGEDGIEFTGSLSVPDSIVHFGTVIAENELTFAGHVGIGTAPSLDHTLMVHDGIHLDAHGSVAPGVWINKPGNIPAEANFIGDRGDQTAGFKTASGWNFLQSGITNRIGIGMPPAEDKLSIAGSCKAVGLDVGQNAWFKNGVRFADYTNLHFNQEVNFSSNIVYTPNSLEFIVYTPWDGHHIRLEAEGGVTTDGPVTVADTLKAGSISTLPWQELGQSLQNGWVNYGDGFAPISMYKDLKGVVHLRGLIKNGLNQQNTVIVNLPAGYRPVNGHQIYAVPNGNNTAGRIDVETDGDVVFRGSTNAFISLDQISFKTN
jgi:hypothetical protein